MAVVAQAEAGREKQNALIKMNKDMIIKICLFMALFTFNRCGGDADAPSAPSGSTGHLTTASTVREVLEHPAFEGFSRYILPLEWGYDEDMPLSRVARLLPYHNYVDAVRCVDCINQMIDSVAAGRKIFYDLGRTDAGLFFFRGRPGAPFAVICPGGGFSYVGSIHEGFPYALELSRMGYNAFVIQYRTGDAQAACEDLATGIQYIFDHSAELRVDTAGYSLWGQLGGGADGRLSRLLWDCGIRGAGVAPSRYGGDGLHGSQRVHPSGPADLFRGGVKRRHCQPQHDAAADRGLAGGGHPGGVSPFPRPAPWLRTGHGDHRRGLD